MRRRSNWPTWPQQVEVEDGDDFVEISFEDRQGLGLTGNAGIEAGILNGWAMRDAGG